MFVGTLQSIGTRRGLTFLSLLMVSVILTIPLRFINNQLINFYEMETYITVSSGANLSASTVSMLSLLCSKIVSMKKQ